MLSFLFGMVATVLVGVTTNESQVPLSIAVAAMV